MSDNDKLIADIQSDNNALIKKLDQLDERILELERQNELLRAVMGRVSRMLRHRTNIRHYHGRVYWEYAVGDVEKLTDAYNAAVAATDGGALDKDGGALDKDGEK